MSTPFSGAPGLAPRPLGRVCRSALQSCRKTMVSLRHGSGAPAHLGHTGTKDSGTWAFSPGLRPRPAPASTFGPGVPRGATPSTTRPRTRALLTLAALTTCPLRPGPYRAPVPGSAEPAPTWQLRRLAPAQPGPSPTADHSAPPRPDRQLPPGRSQGRGRCAHTGHARGARVGGKSAGSEPSRPGRRGGAKRRLHWACLGRTGQWEVGGAKPRGAEGRGRKRGGPRAELRSRWRCPGCAEPLGSLVRAE